jgi:ethanolamine utilization cobalamin adenosyltransferase
MRNIFYYIPNTWLRKVKSYIYADVFQFYLNNTVTLCEDIQNYKSQPKVFYKVMHFVLIYSHTAVYVKKLEQLYEFK